MDDTDIMAAMGIAGFGKQKTQRQLDPKRFEKNKRDETVSVTLGEVFLGDAERCHRAAFHLLQLQLRCPRQIPFILALVPL